ncbi:hypothetical protein BDV35DRAFT_145489 [Aspergillus flavus]|uniref:Uncharacterized protein n=1 Tax=Aspergillus flavus TaxID=5059 RepID=A0A5N6GEB2_ASPFL|nr:hypothetical protein BDV35DRAFT_145489 [Aspergillus flavus]
MNWMDVRVAAELALAPLLQAFWACFFISVDLRRRKDLTVLGSPCFTTTSQSRPSSKGGGGRAAAGAVGAVQRWLAGGAGVLVCKAIRRLKISGPLSTVKIYLFSLSWAKNSRRVRLWMS